MANVVERTFPKFIVNRSRNALVYAGIKTQAGLWIMVSLGVSLFLGIICSLLLSRFTGIQVLVLNIGVAAILAAVIFEVLHNVVLYYGQNRTLQIEGMLPDALQLISANLRADIPIHKALLLAAKPEFGLLAQELGQLGDEILSGKPTEVAFNEFSERVRSPLVTRIATLTEEGLKSGHDVAGLLEQVAYDIRAFRVLQEEANANIGSYVLFIMMAVVVIAPVLYSISIGFIDLSSQVKSTLQVGELVEQVGSAGSSPLVGLVSGDAGVSADTLAWFAGLNLAVSAGIAAILVSVLQTGEPLQKLPYVPMFVVVAEAIFFVAISAIKIVLGGLFI